MTMRRAKPRPTTIRQPLTAAERVERDALREELISLGAAMRTANGLVVPTGWGGTGGRPCTDCVEASRVGLDVSLAAAGLSVTCGRGHKIS